MISSLAAGVITAAGYFRLGKGQPSTLASAVAGGWTHVKRGAPEGRSKNRKCSSAMSYQEQPPAGSPRIEVEARSIVRRSSSAPGSADSNERS